VCGAGAAPEAAGMSGDAAPPLLPALADLQADALDLSCVSAGGAAGEDAGAGPEGTLGIEVMVEVGADGAHRLRVAELAADGPAEASGAVRCGDVVEAVDGAPPLPPPLSN